MLPLPCSFKIFLNVFTFLHSETNSKEIHQDISFLSFFFFFQKKFKAIRAFPSCHLPLYQNKSSCKTICMGMCSLYGFCFMQIKLSFYERFCTKTCFKTDAPVDSEMTFYLEKMLCLPPFLCRVPMVSHTTILIGSCR